MVNDGAFGKKLKSSNIRAELIQYGTKADNRDISHHKVMWKRVEKTEEEDCRYSKSSVDTQRVILTKRDLTF